MRPFNLWLRPASDEPAGFSPAGKRPRVSGAARLGSARTVALYPGEIMGRLGPPTFAVYDNGTGDVERQEL